MNRVVIISGLMALAWTTSAHSSGNSSTTLPTVALEQRQSTDEFLARWNDERNGRLMQSAFWTLAHDYAD